MQRGRGGCTVNPAQGVPRYLPLIEPIVVLTEAQIEEQLAALSDQKLRTIVILMIYAGLHRSDVSSLRREDIDMNPKSAVITVRRQFGPRLLPIGKRLYPELARYLETHTGQWLFPDENGSQWNPEAISESIEKANTATGLGWSYRNFQSTFAAKLHKAIMGLSHYVARPTLEERRAFMDSL